MRVQSVTSWVGLVLCAAAGSAGTVSHFRPVHGSAPEAISATAAALGTSQPPAARPAIPSSYFGLTVLNYRNINPSLTFATTRTWDAHPALDWAEANPANGRYNFGPLNSFVSKNRERRAEVIYTFGRTPQWALDRAQRTRAFTVPGNAPRPLWLRGTATLPPSSPTLPEALGIGSSGTSLTRQIHTAAIPPSWSRWLSMPIESLRASILPPWSFLPRPSA